MELRQLEYFVAVAEEANFTRAAARVHISQSGVSAQVKQLEYELGQPLLDRSGRTATLTPAGAAALEHARAVLASVDAVRQAVDDLSELVRGRLVVGMPAACTITGLFDALAAFHQAHPGVELTLVEENSDRLIDAVRSGAMDLALVATADVTPPGLGALTIISERIVALMPSDHVLARQQLVTLADLTRQPVICMPVGTGIRTVFDRGCLAAEVTAAIALQASAPATVADLAMRGLGVAILTESMATEYVGRLEARIIEDVKIPAILALIWSPTTSPALRELLVHTHSAFAASPR